VISRELEAEILRLYHTEKWPVGTLARQLKVHRDMRPEMVEPFIPFIQERVRALADSARRRMYSMARERGYP